MASVDGRRSGEAARRVPCTAARRDLIHVSAIRADDELIEMVRGDRVPTAADPLVGLLLAWRAEVNRPR